MKKHVLIVEDSSSLARTYCAYLTEADYEIVLVEHGEAALERLTTQPFDVVILDVQLPGISGLDVLAQIKKDRIPVETVVITANSSVNLAVDAMRAGAFDFISKPFNAKRLQVTVANAIQKRNLQAEIEVLREEVAPRNTGAMVCESPVMQSIYRMIRNTARSKATVFITGESGSGKEVCAKTLHELSDRASGPLVTLNCAAIPKDLIESEIFGHVKGAYTGATSDREGAALRANGGTLFLDEICEMDVLLQAKLLRFLQTRTVQRLGEDKVRESDVRFVCATNRDPVEEVRAGRFREDLFYRLFVIPIDVPPLRERVEDIIPLAEKFLAESNAQEGKSFSGFDIAACDALVNCEWPGNVRQLENLIRNAVVLNDGEKVTEEMLAIRALSAISRRLNETNPSAQSSSFANPLSSDLASMGRDMRRNFENVGSNSGKAIRPLEDVVRETILGAIDRCDGSVPRAAELLDVSPSTIYRRLENWGIGKNLAAA